VPNLAHFFLRNCYDEYGFLRIFFYLRKIADNLEQRWNEGSYKIQEIQEFFYGLAKIFE
jgi:hypothetical protein